MNVSDSFDRVFPLAISFRLILLQSAPVVAKPLFSVKVRWFVGWLSVLVGMLLRCVVPFCVGVSFRFVLHTRVCLIFCGHFEMGNVRYRHSGFTTQKHKDGRRFLFNRQLANVVVSTRVYGSEYTVVAPLDASS